MRKIFRTYYPSVASSKIAVIMQKLQLGCVRWMQKQEAKWSRKQKRLYLAVFLIISCAAYMLILFSGLYHSGLSGGVVPVTPMRTPLIQQSNKSHINLNTDDTLKAVMFLQLVDSLQLSPEGRILLDKYFLTRPGMRDSIPLLKRIFF